MTDDGNNTVQEDDLVLTRVKKLVGEKRSILETIDGPVSQVYDELSKLRKKRVKLEVQYNSLEEKSYGILPLPSDNYSHCF